MQLLHEKSKNSLSPHCAVRKIWCRLDADEGFFFLSTRNGDRWRDHPFEVPVNWPDVREFIEDHADCDLYFSHAIYSRPRRLKANVLGSRYLHADLDEREPFDLDPRPSVAWETSPGRFAGLWLLEDFVSDFGPVNKALTYAIGADKCWDMPHVLRIPGTRNYKYDGAPRGQLLWSSGTKYSLDDFPAPLPEKRRKKRSTTPRASGPVKISSKRQKEIRSRLRGETRLFLDGRGAARDRSKVIWRLINELRDAGASEDETFELLRGCRWNKYGDDSLMQQIEKAGDEHAKA
jgi:hypothetical protein